MNWKKVARKLRTRYRAELKLERARTKATQDALKMMVNELASALQGEVEMLEQGWDTESN